MKNCTSALKSLRPKLNIIWLWKEISQRAIAVPACWLTIYPSHSIPILAIPIPDHFCRKCPLRRPSPLHPYPHPHPILRPPYITDFPDRSAKFIGGEQEFNLPRETTLPPKKISSAFSPIVYPYGVFPPNQKSLLWRLPSSPEITPMVSAPLNEPELYLHQKLPRPLPSSNLPTTNSNDGHYQLPPPPSPDGGQPPLILLTIATTYPR